MIQFGLRRWRLLMFALIVVALAVIEVHHVLEKRAERKREITYQSTLRSYSERFKPGTARKEVEDYLRARNIGFRQMCCVDSKPRKTVWDDLTKIGNESVPWFCSENSVYVAFQFTGIERNGGMWDADPSDTLKAVSAYHWLEGCL
jgi:hypothetical protein